MTAIPKFRDDLVRHLGLAAAALLLLGLPGTLADATSLMTAGAMPNAKQATERLATEVRFGGGGAHVGGGGGMHVGGGGMHVGGGGMHVGGGGFHAAPMFHGGGPVFHGGGMRYGGIRYGGMRYGGMRYGGFGWHHHFHHRHFFFGGFYPYYGGYYPYYYPYRRCRIVWTYFGPRRVCRWPRLYPWAY